MGKISRWPEYRQSRARLFAAWTQRDFGVAVRPVRAARASTASVCEHRSLSRFRHGLERDPFELLDVLERIKTIFSTNSFDFINVSIGPSTPIDDDEIDPWTALFDEYLADGKTLAAFAVGNNGTHDAKLGHNRVQVPSDCVNGLAVGAIDSVGSKWKRAPYSAVGPGRRPGIVKPDIVGFGGSEAEPFFVLDGRSADKPIPLWGTSFASPLVLRTAIGLRAHFGQLLAPLAIKALMINCAERRSHAQHEVGWGKVPDVIDDLVTCPDGVFAWCTR